MAASILSLLITCHFNHMGTIVGSQSRQEMVDWEQFSREFPTKSQYTLHEFEQRGAEIQRIQEKYHDENLANATSKVQGHLFFKETAQTALLYSWAIWFMIPTILRLPPISSPFIMLFPSVFLLIGLFYPFEVATFLGAYCVGIGVRLLASKVGTVGSDRNE